MATINQQDRTLPLQAVKKPEEEISEGINKNNEPPSKRQKREKSESDGLDIQKAIVTRLVKATVRHVEY